MDIITISTGITLSTFGIYTFYVRLKSPEKLSKLQAMKDKFGSTTGMLIHTIGYSILPLILGGMIVTAGINGISIMQFISS